MTGVEERKCAKIIDKAYKAALAAGAVSELAVTGVQIKMVMDLAEVFGVPMTSAVAKSIVNYAFSGGFLWEAARWILPPSRIIAAFHSADKTEDFGWRMARTFDEQASADDD